MSFPKRALRGLRRQFRLLFAYVKYLNEFSVFKKTHGERFSVRSKDRQPILLEADEATSFDKHYVYHTGWAARKLAQYMPKKHVDISSYTYFSTLVSAFIDVDFYDYRPVKIELTGLTSQHGDLLDLPFTDASVKSISCMHVIEHIGLGRYGDPLDPDADIKAMAELRRVLAIDGNLLFVVPVGGTPIIMFNAHRIYSYSQIVDVFKDFELVEFSLIPDKSEEGIILNASEDQANKQKYGCGCFWFRKLAA